MTVFETLLLLILINFFRFHIDSNISMTYQIKESWYKICDDLLASIKSAPLKK